MRTTGMGTRGPVYTALGGESKWRGRLNWIIALKAVAREARARSSVLDLGGEGLTKKGRLTINNTGGHPSSGARGGVSLTQNQIVSARTKPIRLSLEYPNRRRTRTQLQFAAQHYVAPLYCILQRLFCCRVEFIASHV